MKARLPQGMGGGPSNMQGMMKQVQKMQEQMTELQEDLDAREYDVNAGGGAVSVKINGKKEILSISIKPEIVDPDDIETLSDVLVRLSILPVSAKFSRYRDFYIGLFVIVVLITYPTSPSIQTVLSAISSGQNASPRLLQA